MKFSLLMVTTNRLLQVERLFRSLVEQTYKNFEVIFAHLDSCSAEAFALTEKFRKHLEIKTVCVPDHGVSRARNLALPLLSGEFTAFPDDDCIYPPDTLSGVRDIFLAHPEVDALLAHKADLAYGGSAQEAGAGFGRASGDTALRRMNRYSLFGCSETFLQFYRSPCIKVIGEFDEKLGPGTGLPYGCGEDTDYALRALQAGFNMVRAPSARVLHPAVDYGAPALQTKVAAYAGGRMYLLRKHALPLWFRLANVVFPLAALIWELPTRGLRAADYRRQMFYARLANF